MFPHYGMKAFCGRRQQRGPYAPDGYAGGSREMAVCHGTTGPGVTNMTSGIAQAYHSLRLMLFFAGMHGLAVEDQQALAAILIG